MLAQRYPTAFDGIMAAAPEINWPSFLVGEIWPQFVMNQLGAFPPGCVTDAITAATMKACDDIDGVVDGVISMPDLCSFGPLTLVGPMVDCNGTNVHITRGNALVVIVPGRDSGLRKVHSYGMDSTKARPCQRIVRSSLHRMLNNFKMHGRTISNLYRLDQSVCATGSSVRFHYAGTTELSMRYSGAPRQNPTT
jgi:hypothetical protein